MQHLSISIKSTSASFDGFSLVVDVSVNLSFVLQFALNKVISSPNDINKHILPARKRDEMAKQAASGTHHCMYTLYLLAFEKLFNGVGCAGKARITICLRALE